MTLRFGILVFPNVQQLDLTGPYEVFASVAGAEVELIWKDRNPVVSSTRLLLQPSATFADCPPLDVLMPVRANLVERRIESLGVGLVVFKVVPPRPVVQAFRLDPRSPLQFIENLTAAVGLRGKRDYNGHPVAFYLQRVNRP